MKIKRLKQTLQIILCLHIFPLMLGTIFWIDKDFRFMEGFIVGYEADAVAIFIIFTLWMIVWFKDTKTQKRES